MSAAGWGPVALAEIVAGVKAGKIVGPVPTVMPRTDGAALLYPGEVHSLAGEPESAKGWIVLAECARLLSLSERVLYLDFEDAPASVVARLLALGAPPSGVVKGFAYVKPNGKPPLDAIPQLLREPPTLAVVDGLSEAYALLGLDYSSNTDVPLFLQGLARPLAASGAAVLQVDHVAKDKTTRGRFAIGAQHKLAGVAVAYGVEVIERPSRQQAGRVKVTVHKDRHGHVRGHAEGAVIAVASIVPEDDGARVTVTLDPPDTTSGGTFRPTRLMERVSRHVESAPGSSVSVIRDSVPGKNDYVVTALGLLVDEGYVTRERDGQAWRHTSARPYREADDVADRAERLAERHADLAGGER